MKKLKDFKNNMKQKNNSGKKRDNASWFLILFVVILAALAGRAFHMGGTGIVTGTAPVVSKPVQLSFSDVLRRGDEIKTMRVNGSDATGTLADVCSIAYSNGVNIAT